MPAPLLREKVQRSALNEPPSSTIMPAAFPSDTTLSEAETEAFSPDTRTEAPVELLSVQFVIDTLAPPLTTMPSAVAFVTLHPCKEAQAKTHCSPLTLLVLMKFSQV